MDAGLSSVWFGMEEFQHPSLPAGALHRDDLAQILFGLTDYIGVHQVVFDEFGTIVDAELMWWNSAYKKIRVKPVEFRQSMVATYFEPHVALSYVSETWNNGRAFQLFELPSTVRDRYREPGMRVAILVNWQRVGDYIVEAGGDMSEFLALQDLLSDQQSLVAIASKRRALAVERERIGRNLHDSVIQHLYASSLSLGVAARKTDDATATTINTVMSTIDGVITEIRNEILDIENRRSSPLRIQLEDVLIPVLSPTGADFELAIDVDDIDPDLFSQIRSVTVEAASNAVRHGSATRVAVYVERDGPMLRLTVSDNGTGIREDAPLQNGLNNMRNRAESLGGEMTIKNKIGGGTLLEWSVPHPGWTS